MTKNRLSFAGSQTLLASENEFNSTGNFNSAETVGDARKPISWRRQTGKVIYDQECTQICKERYALNTKSKH